MNKTFKIIKFVSIFVLLGTFNSFAGNHAPDTRISLDVGQQKRQVSGIVTDHKGEAIIGANVIEKGTTNGTVTDINGNFTLQVEGDAILHISYIGYQVQDIPSAGKTNFEVVLQEDSKALDEVVVVGYGTMRKKDLTGAVAAVDGKLLETRKSTHLTQALQGALPGVTITRSSGDPKEGAGINIRGITSMNGSTPLVIVDGVPGIDINNINARDVESISEIGRASCRERV